MISPDAPTLSTRLTRFADAAADKADMHVKLPKTFTQHVKVQQKVTPASAKEIKKIEDKYEFPCLFQGAGCDARFKTKSGMLTHTSSCPYNYDTTQNFFEIERIVGVYGHNRRKLFKVQWRGYKGADSWEPEHSLLRDGCKDSIDEFWLRTGINPAQDFYPDPENRPRCVMCGWTANSMDPRYVKAHQKRKGHQWNKRRAHTTAKRDVKRNKLKQLQQQEEKVRWGSREVENCWNFKYLGALFQPDGDHMPDVREKIARAKKRAGQLRHILCCQELELDLRLRLYISGCCSILTYGAEAWALDDRTCATINGANSMMLSHITGRSRHDEASAETTSFNLVMWIRARRHKWLGHILRMDDSRLVKQAVRHMFTSRTNGDLLMDIPSPLTITWDNLLSLAQDRDTWRSTIHKMQAKAKGARWKRSRARLKAKRKTTHAPENYTPVSRFTYRTTITLHQQQPQTAHRQKQLQHRKHMAHTEFLTGSAGDRLSLQRQAARSRKSKKRRRQTNSAPGKKRLKQTDIRDFFTTQTAVPSMQTPLKLPAHGDHLSQPWSTPYIQGHHNYKPPDSNNTLTLTPDSLLLATPELAPVTTTTDLWCAPAPTSDNNSSDQWCAPAPTPDDV